MRSTIINVLYENKAASILVALTSSAVVNEFLLEYDWGHILFGIAGFVLSWALTLIKERDEDDDGHKARYWVGKLIFSIFLPLFLTGAIADKFGWNEVLTSLAIGAFPELLIQAINSKLGGLVKKSIKKDKDE